MKLVIWDFDGTLAYRDGNWSATLASIASLHLKCEFSEEIFRPHLSSGFPWHIPSAYRSWTSSEHWWGTMNEVFRIAFEKATGVSRTEANSLARLVKREYLDVSKWHAYKDALPAVANLIDQGWVQIIVSNHVPELDWLVTELGLHGHMRRIYSSAITGWEKPNPEAFLRPIHELSGTSGLNDVVVIGDSEKADIEGARNAGLRSVHLVRSTPIKHNELLRLIQTCFAGQQGKSSGAAPVAAVELPRRA